MCSHGAVTIPGRSWWCSYRRLASGDFSMRSSPTAPGYTGSWSSKVIGMESHRGGLASVGWRTVAVQQDFNGGEWLAVAGCESDDALQHWRGKGMLRGKTNRPESSWRQRSVNRAMLVPCRPGTLTYKLKAKARGWACDHASRGTGPNHPIREGSGVTTRPVESDPASLCGKAPVPPCVLLL
jgi:hypothetical protein